MNKKTIMILVIILGLIGLGYFFMSSKKGTSSTGSDLTSSTSSAPKSLKDLLGMTAAQKCTFSNKTDNMESSGTVYVAGGNSLKALYIVSFIRKCTFLNKTDNMESSGTVYVAGGKINS